MKPSRRHAYSLVELMMVITITAVLMGVCVQTLWQTLPVAESAKHQLEQTGVIMSLAERFRRDAHEATEVTAANGAEVPSGKLLSDWIFVCDSGKTIRYRLHDDQLVREVLIGEDRTHHETYSLPDAAVTGLELVQVGEKRLAALMVTRHGSRPVRIEALVGSQVFERAQ